ncbi:hypothetical protein HOY34_07500 [Xinfangfangia sp. D13-10-4-6]|nr:hypothetical protein [Pseudogemmobacter hezensis]
MLKMTESVKSVAEQALDRLPEMLDRVPGVRITHQALEQAYGDRRLDLVIEASIGGEYWTLVGEVIANGQPRNVRAALHQMHGLRRSRNQDWVPILIAPYLSPEARRLCVEDDVGYLDLHGNARLAFGQIYLEREVEGAPSAERRDMKSLFRPRSAQVLRVLLRDPKYPWRVADLADAAGVSLGHVSNVRRGLIDRDWGRVVDDGLVIPDPGGLLDAWAEAYEAHEGKRLRFYTSLHGAALQEAVRCAIQTAAGDEGNVILASFSAAAWLAPYGRNASQFLYCDPGGLDHASAELMLEPTSKGENVVITVLADNGLFRDAISPAEGIRCTSAVQTWLDLTASGERGREAAAHLRQELLGW